MTHEPLYRTDARDADGSSLRVWDPLVRIFHWSLVAFFAIAYATGDELDTLHTFAGYTIAGLIAFRLVWGIIGTPHARFTDFVTGPGRAAAYLRQSLKGRAPRYIGHNPAGGLMIVVLLVAIAVTAGSGMALIGVDGSGPLAGLVSAQFADPLEEVHEFFANLVLLLVLLHVSGVLVGSILHRENLVRAMITGRKQGEEAWRRSHTDGATGPSPRHAST